MIYVLLLLVLEKSQLRSSYRVLLTFFDGTLIFNNSNLIKSLKFSSACAANLSIFYKYPHRHWP